MTIYGLDVSNHQGDLASLGGVHASFFCHKLTEGTSYLDPNAAHNLAFARSRNISLLGGYHYIRAGNGAGQADYFAARARALFGHQLRGHLWQLDCESDATLADVTAFKKRWDAGTGSAPIFFYTGDWWLQPRGWDVAALGFAGLWAAPNRGYVGRAANVRPGDWSAGYGGYRTITILQYDARAAVGDADMYRGDLADLRALCAGSSPGKVKMYTSVNAHDVALTKGVARHIRFTSAGAPGAWTPPKGDEGGYNVGVAHAAHVGTIALTGNSEGARIRVRFVETDPAKSYRVHKRWPDGIIQESSGAHTVTHWCDRAMHLWVEATALDRDTTIDLAVVTVALT